MTTAVQFVMTPTRGNRTSLTQDRLANTSSSRAGPAHPEPQEALLTPVEHWDMHGIGGPGGGKAGEEGPLDVGRRGPARESSAGSLCVEGKLVPEFYILGDPKCGTTSLANDLRSVGVRSNAEPEKEAHFFEGRFLTGVDYADIRSEWLAASENCTSLEPKRVIGDYSTENMRLVPPPENWVVEQMGLAPSWQVERVPGISFGGFDLPRLFTGYLYRGASPRLTFAVMVREPLDRFQSSWYFAHFEYRGANDFWLRANGTFAKFVVNAISNAANSSEPRYVFRLWSAMYGRHLEQWLNHFHPRQFYYIPFLHYMRPGGRAIVFKALEERLGIALPATEQDEASHSNSNSHPPLDEDLPPLVQLAFRAFMAPEMERFMELLASGSTRGMGLANFSGTPGSVADVRTWLHAGW